MKAGKSDRRTSRIEQRHFELFIDGGMAERYC